MNLLFILLIRKLLKAGLRKFVLEIDILVFFSFPCQGLDVEKLSNEPLSMSGNAKDVSDNSQSGTSEGTSPDSVSKAQRCMSLYFALCTKVFYYFLAYRSC